MKTLKSLAILAMAFLPLISCSKDDSSKEDPTPEETTDAIIYIAVSEQQLSFFEQAYKFDVNGTEVSFKLSDMTELATSAIPESFKFKLDFAVTPGEDEAIIKYKVYSYKLGNLSSGQKVKGISQTWTVKSDRPQQPAIIDILDGYSLKGKSNAVASVSTSRGLPTDEASLTGYADLATTSITSISVEY